MAWERSIDGGEPIWVSWPDESPREPGCHHFDGFTKELSEDFVLCVRCKKPLSTDEAFAILKRRYGEP